MLVAMFTQIPHNYLQYGVAIGLTVLAYVFWREKGENLIETQHEHLHDNVQQIEHEHLHWHKAL